MYQTLRYEKQENIGILTINRPEALNALNSTVIGDLEQAITEVEKDAELGALIITGEGRSFVAGADIGEQRVVFLCRFCIGFVHFAVHLIVIYTEFLKLFAVFLVCQCRIQNRYGTVFTNFTAQIFHALHKAFLCCDRAVAHLLQNDVIPFFILQQLQCFCAEPCFRVQLLT